MPPSMDYAVTGNPVREDIIFADRERARKALGWVTASSSPLGPGRPADQRIGGRPDGLALRRGSDSPHPCHWLLRGGTLPTVAGAGVYRWRKPPH